MVISLFRKYLCLVPYQLGVSFEKLILTYTHFEQNKMKDKLQNIRNIMSIWQLLLLLKKNHSIKSLGSLCSLPKLFQQTNRNVITSSKGYEDFVNLGIPKLEVDLQMFKAFDPSTRPTLREEIKDLEKLLTSNKTWKNQSNTPKTFGGEKIGPQGAIIGRFDLLYFYYCLNP